MGSSWARFWRCSERSTSGAEPEGLRSTDVADVLHGQAIPAYQYVELHWLCTWNDHAVDSWAQPRLEDMQKTTVWKPSGGPPETLSRYLQYV